jgi:HSP20 family molecular chaperone IbpA
VQATYRDEVLRIVVPKARPGEGEPGRVPVT